MDELEKLFKELNEQLLSSNAEKLEQIKGIQKEVRQKAVYSAFSFFHSL